MLKCKPLLHWRELVDDIKIFDLDLDLEHTHTPHTQPYISTLYLRLITKLTLLTIKIIIIFQTSFQILWLIRGMKILKKYKFAA